jgi:hypothetical protein
MNKLFRTLILTLLPMAVLSSCSQMDMSFDFAGSGTVVISGTISDTDTKQPLENVNMDFQAFDSRNSEFRPDYNQKVSTDSKGFFRITATGFTSSITCIVTAEAEGYNKEQKEVHINWSGTSFDEETATFYVNDCDFHLKKR